MLLLAAESLIERDVIATERVAMWAPRVFAALVILAILFAVSIATDISTGNNQRRDEKARREMEGKPRG